MILMWMKSGVFNQYALQYLGQVFPEYPIIVIYRTWP